MVARILLCAFLGILFNQKGLAQSNFREQCRSSLGGRLLKQTLAIKQDTGTIEHAVQTLKKLEAARKVVEKDAAVLEAKLRKDELAIAVRDDWQQKQEHKKRLDAEIHQIQDLKEQTAKNREVTETSLKTLTKALEPIFTIRKEETEDAGLTDVALQYRDGCPRFLVVCPLPEKTAKRLLTVLPPADLPDSCQKYAQQRIPDKP